MEDVLMTYLRYSLKALVLLFLAYAALFTLLHSLQRLGLDRWPPTAWLIKLLTAAFVLADWWVNLVISPLFLDPPADIQELVTGRLQRYKHLYGSQAPEHRGRLNGWRLGVANYLCRQLNRFDAHHC